MALGVHTIIGLTASARPWLHLGNTGGVSMRKVTKPKKKSQKVLGANSNVCRRQGKKLGGEPFYIEPIPHFEEASGLNVVETFREFSCRKHA